MLLVVSITSGVTFKHLNRDDIVLRLTNSSLFHNAFHAIYSTVVDVHIRRQAGKSILKSLGAVLPTQRCPINLSDESFASALNQVASQFLLPLDRLK